MSRSLLQKYSLTLYVITCAVGLLTNSPDARQTVLLLPLVNTTGSQVDNWIGSAIPDCFFRTLQYLSDVQVYDPLFMVTADPSTRHLDSDSLLKIHHTRWEWDAAIGGSFTVANDTVDVTLFMLMVRDGKTARCTFEKKSAIDQITGVSADLLARCCDSLAISINTLEPALPAAITTSTTAYKTYAQAYWFEMNGRPEAALSAYLRTIEIDPTAYYSLCKAGDIYLQSGQYKQAQTCFTQATTGAQTDPLICAAIAASLINDPDPNRASIFVQTYRIPLSRTVAGMTACAQVNSANGEYQRAISLLTRVVAAGAPTTGAQYALGKAYIAAGNYQLAVDVFYRLLVCQPDNILFSSHLGTALRNSGKLMESMRVLETALKREPENCALTINLAYTWFSMGGYTQAERSLVKLKELYPHDATIDINLAVVYWYMGRKKEAMNKFLTITNKGNTAQSALNNQATIHFLDGNIDGAIAFYEQARKQGKPNAIVLGNLGAAYMQKGNSKKAYGVYCELLLLAPERVDVLLQTASLAEKLGKLQETEQNYRKALEFAPGDRDVTQALVGLLIRQGRTKEAIDILETYVRDVPSDQDLLLMQADAYVSLGWHEVALMKYEAITSNFSHACRGYYGMGQCMYQLALSNKGGDADRAIYYLKMAESCNPADPDPDVLMGTIYLENKRYYDRARELFTQALQKTTDPVARAKIQKLIAGVKK